MIDIVLARRFIERVSKYTPYNVNIMDENGIIIASRNPERIGQYHAIAHQIILSGPDILEVEAEIFPGVYKGLNMVIDVDGRREGVVGVTGDPKEIRAAAMMTKMAIETMLRYERIQEERRRRENRKEQFIYLLTRVEGADHQELLSLATQLGYPEEMIRIPILIHLGKGLCRKEPLPGRGKLPQEKEDGAQEELLMEIRKGEGHTPLDFSIAPDGQHLLIFKTVRDLGEELLSSYKEEIREYLEGIKEILGRRGRTARFYVGSFQDNYSHYYYAYKHCQWMEQQEALLGEIEFFYDHVYEYTRYLLPMKELGNMFYIYAKRLGQKQRQALVDTILTLDRFDFHFPQAARELYVHKNTLVYRYNKIKEALGLDPLARVEDRALLVSLCVYLSRLPRSVQTPGEEEDRGGD